jgi:hypothetical protein
LVYIAISYGRIIAKPTIDSINTNTEGSEDTHLHAVLPVSTSQAKEVCLAAREAERCPSSGISLPRLGFRTGKSPPMYHGPHQVKACGTQMGRGRKQCEEGKTSGKEE